MTITADELRDVRAYLDMTQVEFAQFLGVSPRTVGTWEANGVPESKEAKVAVVIGRHLRDLKVLEGMPPLSDLVEDDGEEPEDSDPGDPAHMSPTPVTRRARLLAPFTSRDLLAEVDRRLSVSGERMNRWDALRVEQYERYIAPSWVEPQGHEFPDYSQMSEEDVRNYGLAAKDGDKNIAPGYIPDEP